MIAVLREAAQQRGVTLLRLIQIAAGIGLEESVLIEMVLSGTLSKSRRQWHHELGISRRAIDKAHKAMPGIGISVGTGAAGGLLRVTCYQVDWDAVNAAILPIEVAQSGPVDGHTVSQSVGTTRANQMGTQWANQMGTMRANQLAQCEPVDGHTVGQSMGTTMCPPISSSSSSEKETQDSEESLTTTTSSSTPSAYEMLVNTGVYPTIANRFRDRDPVEIRRLIRYAHEHAKTPAGFIAGALMEGFVAPPTQDELYYDFIER